MKRFYFIGESLSELHKAEAELEASGIPGSQIHICSNAEAAVDQTCRHSISSFMRTNVVHAAVLGALAGGLIAATLLLVARMAGWTETYGWWPFAFAAIVLLGFVTWEGGLFGIQSMNARLRQFRSEIGRGEHLLFVDIDHSEEKLLHDVLCRHPELMAQGVGRASPRWISRGQEYLTRFVHWAP